MAFRVGRTLQLLPLGISLISFSKLLGTINVPNYIYSKVNFFFFQILLCYVKEDATWVGINAAIDKLGFAKETANTVESALTAFQNTYHPLVLIDVRTRNFDGAKLCR